MPPGIRRRAAASLPSSSAAALALLCLVGAPVPAAGAPAPQRAPAGSRGQGGGEPPDEFPVPGIGGDAEIAVDGRLTESAWRGTPPIRLPWEASPGRNAEAPVETVCRAIHDRGRLYLGCRASDPDPGAIRAHLADRDEPFDDDWIRVLLDPFGDRRQAYEFRMNPLGVQMDALYRDGGSSFSWDGIWRSGGRVTGTGYVVEAAIPFRTLNFPGSAEPQRWGIVLERSWPRSREHRIRSIRTDYDERCLLCQAQHLTGVRPGPSGHGVELNPTLTSSRTDRRPGLDAPELATGDVELEPGITGSWRFSSNFQASATVNPDFSQVEADAARLRTNRRFALFFPEKRPFFLERSDIFEVPANLIFTRTVVDPAAGLKLTGKEGPYTLGAFLTRDRATSLIFPGATGSRQTLLDRDVTGFVGRWQRDVGRSSSLGLAVTAREGAGYHNRMAAGDGTLRLGPSTRLLYLAAGTQTDYPAGVAERFSQPEGDFLGYFGAVSVSHGTRSWEGAVTLLDVSPDFRADAGFLPQAGVRRGRASLERTFWTPELPWATRFEVGANGQYDIDHGGRLIERSAGLEASWRGPLQSSLALDVEWGDERFAGRTFALPRQSLGLSFRPSGALEAGLNVTRGKEIDFGTARRADLLRVGPRMEWRPGRHLSLEASHDLERLRRQGETILSENVTELRARWHFNRRAFLRAILQHRHVERSPVEEAPVPPGTRRNVFGQFLFSYELGPRTALFAGYTDTRQGADRRDREFDLRQTRRTFFLKMSYAWRF